MISSPLRSRFSGGVFKLEFYSNEEIADIVRRSSKILDMSIEEDAIKEIAIRSRFTPRTANYHLKRCRDLAQIEKKNLTKEVVEKALAMLGVDRLGLNHADREILRSIINKFNGGPVGLNTIAAALSEEQATIEEVYEPFLLKLGLLERTPRGRTATKKAYEHLGFEYMKDDQGKLL
jgi:Holliday junction DNA helicase RuvB